MTKTIIEAPKGSLAIRTLAMPKDTNANGDIFGGWLVSQMDLGGAIFAKQVSQGRVATVAMETITFLHPVSVGDIVCCYTELLRVGRTSMRVLIEVWTISANQEQRKKVTEGVFTFVAIDENGRPRPVYPG